MPSLSHFLQTNSQGFVRITSPSPYRQSLAHLSASTEEPLIEVAQLHTTIRTCAGTRTHPQVRLVIFWLLAVESVRAAFV